jgi:hypothetical protein
MLSLAACLCKIGEASHDLFFLCEIMVRSWFDCLKMGAFVRFLSHQCALESMGYDSSLFDTEEVAGSNPVAPTI